MFVIPSEIEERAVFGRSNDLREVQEHRSFDSAAKIGPLRSG
jgi:hypothetical protein